MAALMYRYIYHLSWLILDQFLTVSKHEFPITSEESNGCLVCTKQAKDKAFVHFI